jgi:RES domain-containing protein
VKRADRSGRCYRVADPQWINPLDPTYSKRVGGRWNPGGTFAALYLNQSIEVSKANARRFLTTQLEGSPLSADDFEPSELPVLVATTVPADEFLAVLDAEACEAVGLPTSYPLDATGAIVEWTLCQPIGAGAYQAGPGGVACPSAAMNGPVDGEELACFERDGEVTLEVADVMAFADWYGPFDW